MASRRRAGILAVLCGLAWADPVIAGVRVGGPLPELVGATLQGVAARLPGDGRGRTTLVILTFSRSAGVAARSWSERFAAEFGERDDVGAYSVMFLSEVPKFARGVVLGGIRGGLPPERQARTLVVETPAAAWRDDLRGATGAPAADADGPYLALLDAAGIVVWLGHGGLTEERFAALVAALSSPGAAGSSGSRRR